MKKPFIGITGNIGVGKTTFTKLLAQKIDLIPYYESVDDNPYLSDFYSNQALESNLKYITVDGSQSVDDVFNLISSQI